MTMYLGMATGTQLVQKQSLKWTEVCESLAAWLTLSLPWCGLHLAVGAPVGNRKNRSETKGRSKRSTLVQELTNIPVITKSSQWLVEVDYPALWSASTEHIFFVWKGVTVYNEAPKTIPRIFL